MTGTGIGMRNWLLFFLLSFIWGSSFILMKAGLTALHPYQVASIRMISGGLVLLPIATGQLRRYPVSTIGMILLSGLLGSFFPAFLFCIAETRLDSSLAGFMNAFTPLITICLGVAFFKKTIQRHKIAGVIIGFAGMMLLLLAAENVNITYLSYAGFVLLAVLCYAININLVSSHLSHVSPVHIAATGFALLLPVSLVILIYTGYFDLALSDSAYLYATSASAVLGVFGTALATIIFYILIKKAGVVFSSMVTYGVPFVALGWGLIAGDSMTALQVAGLVVILTGVYLTNRKTPEKKKDELLP
ncbi:MAG: DMT family transporter [Chitinophagaceae bacterium]|nr:MAG: DMT family transporter [Chitinophagaceae bacterium]